MWGKSNLKQFYVRQQQNAKKIKGYEYFRKALYISIQLFFQFWRRLRLTNMIFQF